MKIRPVGTESRSLRAERYDETNGRFLQFWEHAQK